MKVSSAAPIPLDRDASAASATVSHLMALVDFVRSMKPADFAAELAATNGVAAADLEDFAAWLADAASELADRSAP